jgi:hypothetical protein
MVELMQIDPAGRAALPGEITDFQVYLDFSKIPFVLKDLAGVVHLYQQFTLAIPLTRKMTSVYAVFRPI